MLTIFAVPKPFSGHIEIIQRNAIKSWLALGESVEILLIGDEQGNAEVAAEFGLTHIPEIELNRFNTPLVSSAFEIAQAVGRGSTLVYANADIILTAGIFQAPSAVPFEKFLISGRRWDLEVDRELDFTAPDWENRLRRHLDAAGRLHEPCGMDYFIFPKGMFQDLPEFGIGRAGWDSWFIYRSLRDGIPVIDATGAITVIHQNHDYSHHPLGVAGTHAGAEAEWNISLAGGRNHLFTLEDVNWLLDSDGLKKPSATLKTFLRKIERLPAFYPKLELPIKLFQYIRNKF